MAPNFCFHIKKIKPFYWIVEKYKIIVILRSICNSDKLSTVFTPAANHPNTAVFKTQPWLKPIKYDFRILHWYNIDGFDYNCSS